VGEREGGGAGVGQIFPPAAPLVGERQLPLHAWRSGSCGHVMLPRGPGQGLPLHHAWSGRGGLPLHE